MICLFQLLLLLGDLSLILLVGKRDDKRVRKFIETVKSWGVNGAPSDGGFGYAKFMLCPGGRNSE